MNPLMRAARRALPLLLASTAVACGGDDLVLPEEGVPTSIVTVTGNNQAGTVRSELPDPITVRVLDVQGRPVSGQEVRFTVISGGGSVEPVTVTTNANGEATIEWTLGGAAGMQQVRVQATGGAAPDDLSIMLSATAGASTASTIEMVSGNEQSATAGSAVNDSLIVRTEDTDGNPVAGVTVTWTLGGAGTLSEVSTVTGADGQTGVRWTLGPAAGAQTAIATAAGLSGSPVTFTATATVGSAGRLVITQQPSGSATSGVALAQQPSVQMQDVNGNNVSISGRAITAELIGPAASLQGNTTVSTTNGVATFTNLAIVGPAGSYTINFTGADLVGVTSSPVQITVGSAAKLAFTVQPSDVAAGAAIAPAIQVTIQDAQGQRVTTATNQVTLSLSTNPGGATLGGVLTANAVNGIATFSNVTLNRAGSGYVLRAASTGLTGANSAAFDVTSGGASTLTAASTVPATTTVGSAVSPAPSVKVTDAGGNPVSGVTVTFTTVGGGSVTGATQTTNAQGVATVGNWTIGSSVGTTYGLSASATGVQGVVLFQTAAAAGAPGKLTIATQPSGTAQSGVPLAQQPALQVTDAAGNPVAAAGISVEATIASGGGTLSGTTTVTTNAEGRAVFTNLSIAGTAGTRTLSFAAAGLDPVVSSAIVVGAGSVDGSQSSVVAEPSAVETGVPTTVTVTLRDAAGNAVAGAGITLSSDADGAFGTTSLTSDENGSASTTYTPGVSGAHLITASAGGATVTATVTVADPVIEEGGPSPGASSLMTPSPTIRRGETAQFDLYVADAAARPLEGIRVAFSSDKDGDFDPRETRTSSLGRASTTFRPNANGAHLIRARSEGVILASATLSVTGSSHNNE